MSYTDFQERIAGINDVLCTLNLLAWDSRTMMPPGGIDARAEQVTTLTTLARELATGEGMRRALDGAREELDGTPREDLRHRAVALAEREIATLSAVPPEITAEMAALKTRAHGAWVTARAANDFSAYAPVLQRMMEMQRTVSAAIGGGEHPYDPLIGQFEPGMTWAGLQQIYDRLKQGIRPLIDRARAAGAPRHDFLERGFPIPQQKAFGLKMAERMGYDLNRGRLDDTAHPFEISFTRSDVRITSRFRESWLPGGTFALWHEAGHGMYEQNVAPEHSRTIFATDLVNLYAVGGASFGMHEAQSRMWENRVGRSPQFWQLHFGELRDHFPDQLSDVTHDEYWRAVNRLRPDFIRVEADELTYDMHIILRSEIEAALMEGSLAVADLPAAWNAAMKDLLDLDVPDDTRGVLQDVHWSHGYVGSFPTYTLGNIMSSQLFAAACRAPGVAEGLEVGDYAPLHTFMRDNVWRHGRASTPAETLERVAGAPLDPGPYLSDLSDKVEGLTA
ncbi:carboxypeptidase M32 [Pseudoruegeria sp. HB172150]|uniref:carboxypeptidase M32 n=1 Tax=Pseudoruegeria sp. HB172150 TaxID=2721164 RepID=UPI0015550934|nr:carboxypeptidase M32 [Pseudoruegeria sp. HB172150]